MALTASHSVISKEITINNIRIGGKAPKSIYKGSVEVMKVTKGSTVVYQKERITYGVSIEITSINNTTTLLSQTSLTPGSISGNNLSATLLLPATATTFVMKVGVTKNGVAQYSTSYFSVTKQTGSFSISTGASSNPYMNYTYSYQANNTTSQVFRGALLIQNKMGSIIPGITLSINQKGTAATSEYKIRLLLCNYYSGTSIQSLSLVMPINGTDTTSTAGGGFSAVTSWLAQREVSWISNSAFTGSLSKLSRLEYTSELEGISINDVNWQLRIHTTASTYANRKTTGTQIFKGVGECTSASISAANTYNITAGDAVRYVWFCEQ